MPGMGVVKYPPLFFSDDGVPLSSTGKTSYKSLILKRFGENDFFFDGQPDKTEKAVIIDGMQALSIAPVLGMRCFKDYVKFILDRKFLHYFSESNEIHICFDNEETWSFSLKIPSEVLHGSKKGVVASMKEEKIEDATRIPCTASQWPSFLANQENQRKLINYIGEKIVELKGSLDDDQQIVFSGCNPINATQVNKNQVSTVPELLSNQVEAITRIFAHAKWTSKSVIKLISPNSSLLAILLLNFQHLNDREILLDASDRSKVIHANKLVEAMENDQDTDLLVLKQRGDLSMANFFGYVYPLIGSEILCSPRSFGPSQILKACIDHCRYIFNQQNGIQCLAKQVPDSCDAYVRFVLALYKKRFANKITLKPEEMFETCVQLEKALETVRKDVWIYTLENNTILPSKDCLELRGKNLAFQLKIWTQVTLPTIEIPDPLTHGWERHDVGVKLIPDSKENMQKNDNIFKTIMRKCKCKKTQCKNGRCVCFNGKQNCSSFCECENCCNPFSQEARKEHRDPSESESETDDEGSSNESGSDLEREDE